MSNAAAKTLPSVVGNTARALPAPAGKPDAGARPALRSPWYETLRANAGRLLLSSASWPWRPPS